MKRPKATASAMAVVARAMPTIAPVDIEPFEATMGAEVWEVYEEPVELGPAVAEGVAVTVLVTTAFTKSKSEELAKPRVWTFVWLTQPREM